MEAFKIMEKVYNEWSMKGNMPTHVVVDGKSVPTQAIRKCLDRLSEKMDKVTGSDIWLGTITHGKSVYKKKLEQPNETNYRTIKSLFCEHFKLDNSAMDLRTKTSKKREYKIRNLDAYLSIELLEN